MENAFHVFLVALAMAVLLAVPIVGGLLALLRDR
jgi:hypothetical protein